MQPAHLYPQMAECDANLTYHAIVELYSSLPIARVLMWDRFDCAISWGHTIKDHGILGPGSPWFHIKPYKLMVVCISVNVNTSNRYA